MSAGGACASGGWRILCVWVGARGGWGLKFWQKIKKNKKKNNNNQNRFLFNTHVRRQKDANGMRCSQAVTHLSTNRTQRCLTSVCGREPVDPAWYGRWRESLCVVVYLSGLLWGPLYLAAVMENQAWSPTSKMATFRKEMPRAIAYDLKCGKTTPKRKRSVPV